MIAKYLVRRSGTPSPTWRSFLRTEIRVTVGMQVAAGAILAVIEAETASAQQ